MSTDNNPIEPVAFHAIDAETSTKLMINHFIRPFVVVPKESKKELTPILVTSPGMQVCPIFKTYFVNVCIPRTNYIYHPTLHTPAYTCKSAQVVTNLQQTCSNAVPTTCQQDVFALLVPSLLTTCYKVVELNRLVTSCSNILLSSCSSTICQQVVSDNLVAT
jgi:hypothetical protein